MGMGVKVRIWILNIEDWTNSLKQSGWVKLSDRLTFSRHQQHCGGFPASVATCGDSTQRGIKCLTVLKSIHYKSSKI